MQIPEITNSGFQLRDYQLELKHGVFDAWRDGAKDICAVLPTGGGKTKCLASIVHEFSLAGIPAMVVAHRQELVGQLSCALAAEGVLHNIIAAKPTIRLASNRHVKLLGRCHYHPDAIATVSSVDTLIRRDVSHLVGKIGLYVTDECFPAWVEVDGRPICEIRVGDYVSAFNEQTGQVERKKVVRLFKNKAHSHMMRLETESRHVVHCTSGHPIFTKRGWVPACELTTDDEVVINVRMHELRNGSGFTGRKPNLSLQHDREDLLSEELRICTPGQASRSKTETGNGNGGVSHVRRASATNNGGEKARPGILQQGMLDEIPIPHIVGNNGENKSSVRITTHAGAKSDAARGRARESIGDSQGNGACSETEGWEWAPGDGCRDGAAQYAGSTRFQTPDDSENQGSRYRVDMPGSLQGGLWERSSENCDRSGWKQSLDASEERAGRPQDGDLIYVRLDSVALYERRDLAELGEGVCDGYVYNIEVEGLHTYIANGIVVHNCHHQAGGNKWMKCRQLFTNALGLGVTATPERADGLGLGRHSDGVADVIIEGPQMRDLIKRGFLTDYRPFLPPSDLDLSGVQITSGGDYNADQLKAASKASHIVGDVVKHYIKIAMGKRGVTFAISVDDAEELAAQFNAAGVPARTLTGYSTATEREESIDMLERGELLQLVTVGVVTEGFDLPAIEVISFARPTQSYSLFIQMFGRALRPSPGKTHAIIIDHVGNLERFIAKGRGVPDTPQRWTLDRKERGARSVAPEDVISLTTCTECFSPYDSHLDACPWCGAVPEVGGGARSAPERVEGDLYEMPADLLAKLRGEADRIVSESPEAVRDSMLRAGASGAAAYGAAKAIAMRSDAQVKLRGLMGQWLNVWERSGIPTRDVQVMFNRVFNVDVLTAQTLGRGDAEDLAGRVAGALCELGQ